VLTALHPGQAYRRSSFDARLLAASPQDMVIMCLDDLASNLIRFEQADLREDRAARSAALTRCIASLTALELGVDRAAPIADALLQFYASAKSQLLGMVVTVEPAALRRIKQDFDEIGASFRAAA
jgi:flagellin-specific chaperone FliS